MGQKRNLRQVEEQLKRKVEQLQKPLAEKQEELNKCREEQTVKNPPTLGDPGKDWHHTSCPKGEQAQLFCSGEIPPQTTVGTAGTRGEQPEKTKGEGGQCE